LGRLLSTAKIEGAAEAAREFQGEFVLAEPEVGDAAEVEAGRRFPSVLAVGRLGAVECIAWRVSL